MPRPTFFELPEEKRIRVTDAAVAEFALHAFPVASLDRIADRSQVSKGSLYQYFADKQELYEWLLTSYLPEAKRKASPPLTGDLFQWLEAAFLSGLELFEGAPLLAALGARAALPTSDPEAQRTHAAIQRTTHAGLSALLRGAQASGQVRSDVNVEVAADLVANLMGSTLLAGLARKVDASLDEVLADPRRLHAIPRRLVVAHVRENCELLRRALAP